MAPVWQMRFDDEESQESKESKESQESQESRGLLPPESGIGSPDPEPGLFDGADEIPDKNADEEEPAADSPSRRSGRRLVGLIYVACIAALTVAIGLGVGDLRRLGISRGIEDVRLTEGFGRAGAETQLRALVEASATTGVAPPSLPQPTLFDSRGMPAETGQLLRRADGSIEVAYPGRGLVLSLRVAQDRAPRGTLRDVVRLDMGETPGPIVNLPAASLGIPGKDRARTVEGVPVRLGMHRIAIGLMDQVGPLLREQEAPYAILHLQLQLESGPRLTLAVPLEADLFAAD
jgi:hypothetical protein